MNWHRSLRTLYLAVLGLQIAALSGLWQAAEFSERRDSLSDETRALIDPLFPDQIQRLDDVSGFLIKLYDETYYWPGDFHYFERRFLRRRMSNFLGLDADKLEYLANTTRQSGTDASPVARYVREQWPVFQDTWRNDIYSSGEFLERYLDQPSRENVLGAQTSHDERFEQLPLIIEMLEETEGELGNCAEEAQDQIDASGSAPDQTMTDQILFCEAAQNIVEEHGRLLRQYYEVRKRVDALAFMDGHLAEQGLLLYGSEHRLAPEIKRVEPVKVLGVSIVAKGNWARWLMLVNLVALTLLYRVLYVARKETFDHVDADAEGWFLLAFPIWMRAILLLVLPVSVFILLLFLVVKA